mgnify:CR=1 FL=1
MHSGFIGIHGVGTYAFCMDPAGAERLRGFRAPGADVAAGSASSPAQGQAERSGSAQAPTTAGDGQVRAGYDWRWVLSAAGVLVVAMVIIAALAFKLGSGSATSANRASATATPTPAATATPLPVTDLYRQVVPSVVLITTSKGSLGSGVIVTDTGTVLTAHHVVSGGGDISIVFADGTKTSATIAAAYPKIDIATLTPKKLPEVVVPATLGGGVAVGSDVVAIGNPLGLRDSTTTGDRFRSEPHDRDQDGRAVRADPVRRRREPGQLRRSASECPGDRRRRRRVDRRPRR